MYTSTAFASILPEILILVLGMLLLVVEPFWKEDQRRNVGWLTAGGLLLAMVISFLFGQPGQPTTTLGGMVRFDWLGFFFKMLFMFAGAATALLLMENERVGHRGEGYLLLLASLIGMNLMATSADLVMLYLAIETTSIPLYVLSGFMLADERSTEAGFKYLLFGALTSTVMLYGFSLTYGFTGTTDLYQLAGMFTAGELSPLVAFGILALILVGLGFKVSVVPFHFWAPDVYEGAPTPVAGFLSTASKAAGFAVLAGRIVWHSASSYAGRIVAGLGLTVPLLFYNASSMRGSDFVWWAGLSILILTALGMPIFTALGGAAMLGPVKTSTSRIAGMNDRPPIPVIGPIGSNAPQATQTAAHRGPDPVAGTDAADRVRAALWSGGVAHAAWVASHLPGARYDGFLSREDAPPERLRRAVAWGTAAVALPGTTVPRPDDVATDGVSPVTEPDPLWRIEKL